MALTRPCVVWSLLIAKSTSELRRVSERCRIRRRWVGKAEPEYSWYTSKPELLVLFCRGDELESFER